MKYFLKKTTFVVIAAAVSLGAGVLAHAQTADAISGNAQVFALAFAFPSFKSTLQKNISNDRQNALNNRDDRNALLEAKAVTASDSPSDTSASSTADIITGLSLSLSNLENIESRIDARAADAAGEGRNIDIVTYPLAEADRDLTVASTTLITIANDPEAMSIASSTAIIGQALDAAKGSLGDALDALKIVVGN